MLYICQLPADDHHPRRPLIGFRGKAAAAAGGGALQVRMPRGVRALARLSDGEALSVAAGGGAARGLAVISPFCVLERPRKSTLKIKNMRPPRASAAGPEAASPVIACTVVRIGRRRVFCTSVDGADNGAFYNRFRGTAGRGAVRMVLIDGAERISPWCDRFDPLSEGLIRFINALAQDNPNLTVLALTDRPEAVVRRDIRARLGLTGEVNRPDRPPGFGANSVQAIRSYGRSQKEAAYGRVLRREIPAALGERIVSGRVFAPAPRGARDGLEIHLFASDMGETDLGRKAAPLSAPAYTPIYCQPHHRPSHELEAPFSEKTAGRFHDVGVVSGPEGQAAWGRFDLDITLDGGVDRWRRLALSGEGRHCLHLTDLPSDLCEADMETRGDPVPQCSKEGCPFGKNALCDYGRRHLTIRQFGPDPVTETLDALRMLDRLLMAAGEGCDPVHIETTDRAGDAPALARLAAVGLVSGFGSPDGRNLEARGLRPGLSAGEMAAAAEGHRGRMGLPGEGAPPDPPDRLARHSREKYRPHIREPLKAAMARGRVCRHLKYDRLFEAAADALISLQVPFGRAVEAMRYRALWNLKEWLRTGGCRQAALIRHFHPVDTGWKCGRCDGCDPTLTFGDAPRTSPLPSDPERLSAAEKLEDWFSGGDGFDPRTGDAVRAAFPDDAAFPYLRAMTVLEGDPGNLPALYLARECAPDGAVNLTGSSLMRAACDRLDFPTVRRLYEGAAERTKPLLFNMLDDAFAPTHCAGGERLLYREAKRLSKPARRIDWLRARCAVEPLREIDFTAWKNRLHNYLEDA